MRSVWLFDALVWTVMSYGVEIWGWKERSGKNTRFLKWILGLKGRTSGYGERGNAEREIEGENWGKNGKIRGKASKRGG